jgi:hypothetical protein
MRMPAFLAALARSLILATLAAAAVAAQAACLTTETEPNDTDTWANSGVCSGVAIAGSLSSSSDYDWYRLDVSGPGTISISLSHGRSVDFDWYLYAATGSYIAYASTTNDPEVGSKAVGSAGTYYLRVKSYSGSGPYVLTVTAPLAGGGGGGGGLPAPVFGPFTVPPKNVGDGPFALTPPTSTSSGAFTYSISDTSVATISGNTVTIKGAGSAVVTASQAADSTHAAGSTSATLTVG